MRRMTKLLLEALLLLSSIAAALYLVRILFSFIVRVDWYWGGALAILAGPALIAAALWLLDRTSNPESRANA